MYIGPKLYIFAPPPFFKNDIFSPKMQWKCPLFPRFSTSSPLYLRFFLNKSSYFFPSQTILHIYTPCSYVNSSGNDIKPKSTPIWLHQQYILLLADMFVYLNQFQSFWTFLLWDTFSFYNFSWIWLWILEWVWRLFYFKLFNLDWMRYHNLL